MPLNNTKFLLGVCLIFLQICVYNYKIVVVSPESVEEAQKWENDQEIAVKLKTLNGDTIGLSHWSPELAATRIPFFFEPSEVDYVFSCFPELLPSEIRQKHLFPESKGVNYQGRIGQVVIFTQGVF